MVMCAAVNGYWTDRWGTSYADEQIQSYVKHLKTVPMNFGEWVGEDQTVDEEGQLQLKAAHIAHAVQRTYRNVKTDQKVSVFLACGPQRHLAIHTPNSCFVAAGYEMAGENPIQFPIFVHEDRPLDQQEKTEFYTVRFRKDETEGSQYIRVFWSWNAGEGWMAPDWPKVTFAWKKALYKLYIMGDVQKVGDDLKDDPRVQFIRDFIPVVDKALAMPAGPQQTTPEPAAAPAA
jgi:hypothetical protein